MNPLNSEHFVNALRKAFSSFDSDYETNIPHIDCLDVFIKSLKENGYQISNILPKRSLVIKLPESKDEDLIIRDSLNQGNEVKTSSKFIENELKESGSFEVKRFMKSYMKSDNKFVSVKIKIFDFASFRTLEKEAKNE